MNVQEELKSETQMLGRLQKERQIKMETLRQDIEEARKRGVRGQALQEYQDRLSLYDGLNQQAIEEVQATIKGLQAELDRNTAQAHARARADLQAMKTKALAQWLLEGGEQESFEEAWPGMEQNILKERTLAALNQNISPALRQYSF